MGKEIQRTRRQSGKEPKSLFRDRSIMAMYPGLRKSITGKYYWETRKNRTDMDKQRRL